MTQDDIFVAIRDVLRPAMHPIGQPPPIVQMVDWHNGQPERMEAGHPDTDALQFPLALVRFEQPQWKGNSRRGYHADITLYVDLVQWPDGRLTSDVPQAEVDRTRATYANVHQVARQLVALTGAGFGPLKLIATATDHSFRKLRVETIAFRTHVKADMDTAHWRRVQPALRDTYTMP